MIYTDGTPTIVSGGTARPEDFKSPVPADALRPLDRLAIVKARDLLDREAQVRYERGQKAGEEGKRLRAEYQNRAGRECVEAASELSRLLGDRPR